MYDLYVLPCLQGQYTPNQYARTWGKHVKQLADLSNGEEVAKDILRVLLDRMIDKAKSVHDRNLYQV
jgi:hypothetical protein